MNIIIHNLKKQFHSKIVVDIKDMHIESGELLGLTGPNGSGMTIVIATHDAEQPSRLCKKIIKFDSGIMSLFENEKFKRRIGLVVK